MPKGIRSLANGGPSSQYTFGGPAITGGGGITPIQMQGANLSGMFPKSRGPVRRAPEPETSEILGPLLGFGANSLLSGLGGLFGKDEPETADEYLKSIGVEDAAIEDKSLLSEIDRAQYDAYRVYGAPTEKDSFGLDEIANLAIASQMGRGGPGFIKGVLDSKKATESDRLNTQVQRQAYVNSLLAPVSLQSMDLENINPDSPDFGRTIKAAFNPRTNTLTRVGTGEALDGDDFQLKDNIRVFKRYQNLTKAKEGVNELRRSYVDQLTNRLMVEALTNEEKKRANDEGFIEAISTGDQFLEYDPQALKTLKDVVGDPDLEKLRGITDELYSGDYAPLAMVNVANGVIGVIDSMPRGGDGKIKGSPLTLTSEILNIGNNALANFDQIASTMGGGNIASYFATEASVRMGLSPDGTGHGAKLMYDAINQVPKGDFNPETGQKDYTDTQLERIRYAEEVFENTSSDKFMQGQTIRDILGEAAYNNTRVKGAMLQLAYMAAAANGQTGRTLSDKDLAFHLKMVGFGQTSSPEVLKENLIDFVDELLGFSSDRIATEFPLRTLRRYNLQNEEHTYEIGGFYKPPQKEERVFVGVDDPEADEDGYKTYVSDVWEDVAGYIPRTIEERYPESKELEKWKTYSSPGRIKTTIRTERNQGFVGGSSIDFLLNEK